MYLSDKDDCPDIVDADEPTSQISEMKDFLKCLDRLNTVTESKPLSTDIRDMMAVIYNEQFDITFNDYLIEGSALYTMGIHYFAMQLSGKIQQLEPCRSYLKIALRALRKVYPVLINRTYSTVHRF